VQWPGYYIQEGGLPGFAQWALEAADTPDEAVRATRFAGERFGEHPAYAQKRPGGEYLAPPGGGEDSDGLMILLGMVVTRPMA